MNNPERQQLLREAVEDVLVPLARLCVSQGLPFAQAEELFKQAYVRAARDARRQAGTASARDVSQVSMATGISRREVTRITDELQPRAAQRTTPANEVFMRWVSSTFPPCGPLRIITRMASTRVRVGRMKVARSAMETSMF